MNPGGICLTCGDRATVTCTCGAPICLRHTRFYVDDANDAINRSARPQCDRCMPPKFPRPYTFARAIERGEVEP